MSTIYKQLFPETSKLLQACRTAWVDNVPDLDDDDWEEMWESLLARDQLMTNICIGYILIQLNLAGYIETSHPHAGDVLNYTQTLYIFSGHAQKIGIKLYLITYHHSSYFVYKYYALWMTWHLL